MLILLTSWILLWVQRLRFETQLKIAKNVGYFKNLDTDLDINFQESMNRIHSIERQLNALISSIRKG